jgi:hypothetical protein
VLIEVIRLLSIITSGKGEIGSGDTETRVRQTPGKRFPRCDTLRWVLNNPTVTKRQILVFTAGETLPCLKTSSRESHEDGGGDVEREVKFDPSDDKGLVIESPFLSAFLPFSAPAPGRSCISSSTFHASRELIVRSRNEITLRCITRMLRSEDCFSYT